MPFPFPCSHVICECSWNKNPDTLIEKKNKTEPILEAWRDSKYVSDILTFSVRKQEYIDQMTSFVF